MDNSRIRAVAALCAVFAGTAFAGIPVPLKNAGFEQVGKDGYPVGWSRHPGWRGERAGHNGSGGIVFTDFGPAPKCSGNKADVSFGPMDYSMMRFSP